MASGHCFVFLFFFKIALSVCRWPQPNVRPAPTLIFIVSYCLPVFRLSFLKLELLTVWMNHLKAVLPRFPRTFLGNLDPGPRSFGKAMTSFSCLLWFSVGKALDLKRKNPPLSLYVYLDCSQGLKCQTTITAHAINPSPHTSFNDILLLNVTNTNFTFHHIGNSPIAFRHYGRRCVVDILSGRFSRVGHLSTVSTSTWTRLKLDNYLTTATFCEDTCLETSEVLCRSVRWRYWQCGGWKVRSHCQRRVHCLFA